MPRFCSSKTTIALRSPFTHILYTSTSIQVLMHTLFNILTTSIKCSYIVCPAITLARRRRRDELVHMLSHNRLRCGGNLPIHSTVAKSRRIYIWFHTHAHTHTHTYTLKVIITNKFKWNKYLNIFYSAVNACVASTPNVYKLYSHVGGVARLSHLTQHYSHCECAGAITL